MITLPNCTYWFWWPWPIFKVSGEFEKIILNKKLCISVTVSVSWLSICSSDFLFYLVWAVMLSDLWFNCRNYASITSGEHPLGFYSDTWHYNVAGPNPCIKITATDTKLRRLEIKVSICRVVCILLLICIMYQEWELSTFPWFSEVGLSNFRGKSVAGWWGGSIDRPTLCLTINQTSR